MTVAEFKALEINAQATLVWESVFIGSRVVDDVYIQRYKLKSFEVDVHYDPQLNKILCIETTIPG